MADGAGATVVVNARDRWSIAPAALEHLIASTGPAHDIVVVGGGASRAVAATLDRFAEQGAIRVVRRDRFLASNEARNLGFEGVKTEWVAFVENDVWLSEGWLDRLVEVGEARDGVATYPAYLQDGPDGQPTVHGLGCDLEITGPVGSQRVKEHRHHVSELWSEVQPLTQVTQRLQAEPHAVAVRRSLVEDMGGFDEDFLSWFEHVDLALHIAQRSGSAWLVPDVTCLYRPSPPISFFDYHGFGLRWSADWYRSSLEHLCAVWGFDLDDPGWRSHEHYRKAMRRRVMTKWPKVNFQIDRATAPVQSWVARRWSEERASAV